MQESRKIEEIIESDTYFDCYASTDANEVEYYLGDIGFRNAHENEFVKYNLKDSSCNHVTVLEHTHPKVRLDVANLTSQEAKIKERELGFAPMSKFRIYNPKQRGVQQVIGTLIKQFIRNGQHLAFVNDISSQYFIRVGYSC